jgi:subtilisin family serine protease
VPTWVSASGYASGDGTSFSSPLVAGAAAWVWTRRPELDVTQLFDLNAEPPLTSPGHGRAEVTARLDVTEDPEDVFRVWVPGHGRVAIRVDAVGLRFRCGEAQPPLLDGSGSDGDRTENVAFRNRTRRGRFVYLDVYPPEHGARSSEYRLRLATTH